ncbi:MAG: RepB family plasmid replication initiator protein [Bacteroidetes bacterium]|nr:RepB family plasmid replication initiator protein [Bacteroidota bacterium]
MTNSMDLTVRKSNELVEVGEYLSKPAKLFVLYLIAMMPEDETEFREMSITYDELKKIVNIDGKRRVSTLDEAEKMMDELDTNPIKFDNAYFRDTVTWFSRKRYYKKDKVWHFIFHDELKPYLLQLKSHFTMYSFWYTVCLSAHSIKFYEMMKRYEYLGKCEIPIDKQKYLLGIEDKYEEYYEYRRWVLDEVQKELATYTDVSFTYEPAKKQRRRIISHRFVIKKNVPKIIPEPLQEMRRQQRLPFAEPEEEQTGFTPHALMEQDPEMFTTLKAWGGREKTILDIAIAYGFEQMRYQYAHTQRMLEEGKIKAEKPFGWFFSALKGNFEDPAQEEGKKKAVKAKEKKQQINKKEQLEKSLKELEKNYYEAIGEICDELIATDSELLPNVVESLRSHISVAPMIRSAKTAEEIYRDTWSSGLVRKKIQESFPNAFTRLEHYPVQIAQVKKQLKMV